MLVTCNPITELDSWKTHPGDELRAIRETPRSKRDYEICVLLAHVLDNTEDIIPGRVRLDAIPHPNYLIAQCILQALKIISLADRA